MGNKNLVLETVLIFEICNFEYKKIVRISELNFL